jgi:hypothetical protein
VKRAALSCAAFTVLFVVAFFTLRATATFARVQARAGEAAVLAREFALADAEVLALLDLHEGRLSGAEWHGLCARVVAARAEFGDLGLGVAAAMGHAALVRSLCAGTTIEAARGALRARPQGLVMTRFLAMVERYRAPR